MYIKTNKIKAFEIEPKRYALLLSGLKHHIFSGVGRDVIHTANDGRAIRLSKVHLFSL